MSTSMEDPLHLQLSYLMPSLVVKAEPSRKTLSQKLEIDEVDVPDLLATSSWSEEEDCRKPRKSSNKVIVSIEDQETLETDDVSEGESDTSNSDWTGSFSGSVGDVLSAALHEDEEADYGGEADDEAPSRRQSLSRIPSSIILLEDNLLADGPFTSATAADEDHPSSIEERLQGAETLLKSYRETIQSHEHLVDSLHQTLAETREQAQNLFADRNELLQAIDLLHAENEDHSKDERISSEPKYFVKMAMTIGLMLYLSGIASEYALVATVVVYLLEDVL